MVSLAILDVLLAVASLVLALVSTRRARALDTENRWLRKRLEGGPVESARRALQLEDLETHQAIVAAYRSKAVKEAKDGWVTETRRYLLEADAIASAIEEA